MNLQEQQRALGERLQKRIAEGPDVRATAELRELGECVANESRQLHPKSVIPREIDDRTHFQFWHLYRNQTAHTRACCQHRSVLEDNGLVHARLVAHV